MTSRERMLAAVNHRVPDRVPLDFSGHRSSGIAAIAYPKLRAALGLAPRVPRVYDPVQQLALLDEDVLDCLGVDTVELGRALVADEKHWTDWTLPDGTSAKVLITAAPVREPDGIWALRSRSGRTVARMPEGACFFDQTYWPYLEQENLEDLSEGLAENPWTGVRSTPAQYSSDPAALAEAARGLRQSTDRAIVALFGGNLFETGTFLYRIDRFLMLLAEDHLRVHAFLDKVMETHLAALEVFLKAVGPHVDIVNFGDDLGGQNGPLMSPRMYAEYFKPRHRILWARARELAPNVKIMLHCCGGVRPLLPHLIEAGLDIINPVQVSSRGMEAAGLKRDFGRDLVFWGGGCDTQKVLPCGTPDEVRAHVARQIEEFAPGGGFVFQQVHNIQANVPPENMLAMFEAVRASRVYA